MSRRLKILIKSYLVPLDWWKKADYNTKIAEIKNKIPSVTGLVTTVVLNTKAIQNENKIFDFTNLTAKQNKLPDITNTDNKATLNTKDTEIENKVSDTTGFITTPKFNRLTKISFDEKKKKK